MSRLAAQSATATDALRQAAEGHRADLAEAYENGRRSAAEDSQKEWVVRERELRHEVRAAQKEAGRVGAKLRECEEANRLLRHSIAEQEQKHQKQKEKIAEAAHLQLAAAEVAAVSRRKDEELAALKDALMLAQQQLLAAASERQHKEKEEEDETRRELIIKERISSVVAAMEAAHADRLRRAEEEAMRNAIEERDAALREAADGFSEVLRSFSGTAGATLELFAAAAMAKEEALLSSSACRVFHPSSVSASQKGCDENESAAQTDVCLTAAAPPDAVFEHVLAAHLRAAVGRTADLERVIIEKDAELTALRAGLVQSLPIATGIPTKGEKWNGTREGGEKAPNADSEEEGNRMANDAEQQYLRTIANLKASLAAKDALLAEVEEEARDKIDEKRHAIRGLEGLLADARARCEALECEADETGREERERREEAEASAAASSSSLRAQYETEFQQQLAAATASMDANIRAHYEDQFAATIAEERAAATSRAEAAEAVADELRAVVSALSEQLAAVDAAARAAEAENTFCRESVLPDMQRQLAALQAEIDRRVAAEGAEAERRQRQQRALIGALQELKE